MSASDLHVSQAGNLPWNLSPEKFASILDRVIDGMDSKEKEVNILYVGNGICTSFLHLIRMRAEKKKRAREGDGNGCSQTHFNGAAAAI